MKLINVAIALAVLLTGAACTSSSSPIMTAVNSVGCDVEAAITGSIGSAVVNACKGSASSATCGGAFQSALGNVNLCLAQVPSLAPSFVGVKVFTKVGDVTAGDIANAKAKGGVKANAIKPMGVVGNIACPIAVNTIMGYLTAQIPIACGCTVSLTASQIDTAITSACEAAVPL